MNTEVAEKAQEVSNHYGNLLTKAIVNLRGVVQVNDQIHCQYRGDTIVSSIIDL